MVLTTVLKALWRMLEPRRRVYFVILAGWLFVTGVFEMASMMALLAYIRGLAPGGGGGRFGLVKKAVGLFYEDPTLLQYSIVGGCAVVGIIALKHGQGLLSRYHLNRFLSNLHFRIAQQVFGALAAMPYEDVIRHGGGRGLKDRLTGTLEILNGAFHTATKILADGAIVLMILLLLFFVDHRLTLLGLALFGGAGLTSYRILQRELKRMGRIEHEANKKVKSALDDAFGGLVEARLRDRVTFFQKRYASALGQANRIGRKENALGRLPGTTNELLLALAIVTTVIYMVVSDKNVSEALPILGVFGFAGMRANSALSRVTKGFQSLRQRAERFEKRVKELEKIAPRVLGSSNVDVPSYLAAEKPLPEGRDGRLHHAITLNDVSFVYPSSKKKAVSGVSLTIARGEFVAFCGGSGGGKSTLAMLLMGLLQPTKGQVLCDDWSVFEHIRAWQKNIGYVGQMPYLANATVRENVAFGEDPTQVSDEKCWAALELAAARGFVEELPKKLDTQLSASSGGLSGGQRQRIVIARALYHDPDIIVFDEATAALDNITEQEITDAALRLRGTKTVICIAHRLSTIEKSDRIHLMENGKVVASGTYAELLETSPEFKRLARVSE
jgi:ABC-type multidrug transport system fused ATPase/permease subunit